MDDWLIEAREGDRVLDIASATGSFPTAGLACCVIALDEDPDAFADAPDAVGRCWRVIGRSERMPVASASIDLAVCSHALEHFQNLDAALDEIRRVLKPEGRLFVSVPDGYQVCDTLYRWLFQDGGHVNRFRREDLVRRIEARVGLRLAAWQKLYSSFTYLRNIPGLRNWAAPDLQPRLKRFAQLPRAAVDGAQAVLYAATRIADRLFATDSAVYGWALWFAPGAGTPKENPPWRNVCLHCGAGHPAEAVGRLSWRRWICPACHRCNPCWLRR